MTTKSVLHLVIIIAVSMGIGVTAANATSFIGPLGGTGISGEFAQKLDSPWIPEVDFAGGYFHFEDFEDGLLNTPGVTADNGGVTSVIFGPGSHDSVDFDDGTIDGSGLAGDTWFFTNGATGVKWTFNANVLGSLPTHAGIVWTNGGVGQITFEAFDAIGVSLGTVIGNHAGNDNFQGQTNSDRFYGVVDSGGISAIKLSNVVGGIEMDHLQYGNPVPEPTTVLLLGAGLVGLLGLGRKKFFKRS